MTKKILAVTGMEGVGKKTILHWISNSSNLKSFQEKEEDGGQVIYKILSEKEVSINSKNSTVIRLDEKLSIIDLPNFNESEDATELFSSSYTLQSIIDHVSSIKFVLVIPAGALGESVTSIAKHF